MNQSVALIALTVLAAPALAADMKPGLWEMKIIKAVHDGKDTAAQMSAAQEQARRAMAKMTPQQRAQMEAMMKEHGGYLAGADSAIRMCITDEQARRKELRLDPEGRCQPSKTSGLLGDAIHYEFDCTTAQGVHMKGSGDMKFSSTSIHGSTDMSMTDAKGATHTMQQESQMTWLGADCKGLAPMGTPARK